MSEGSWVEDLFRGEKGLSPRFPRMTPATAGGLRSTTRMRRGFDISSPRLRWSKIDTAPFTDPEVR